MNYLNGTIFSFIIIMTCSCYGAISQKTHIEENNEALRIDGTNPYLSYYQDDDFRGYIQHSANSMKIANRKDTPLHLITNGINRMTILGQGQVGIGTINPLEKLDIREGNIRLSTDAESGGGLRLYHTNQDVYGNIELEESGTTGELLMNMSVNNNSGSGKRNPNFEGAISRIDTRAGHEGFWWYWISPNQSPTPLMQLKASGDLSLSSASPQIQLVNNASGQDRTTASLSESGDNVFLASNYGAFHIATGDNGQSENRLIINNNGSWHSGKHASTNGRIGCVFLADSDPENDGLVSQILNDEFMARFKGGYYFMTSGSSPHGDRTGIRALSGANAWSSICDINRKENFETLDDIRNLEKLASVDYTSWNYKGQDAKTFRHYGIMAQEFYDLFGKDSFGTIGNDTLVNAIDMLGVTMSALKGANMKIEEHAERISDGIKKLSEKNHLLREELHQMKKLIQPLLDKK